MRAFVAQMQAVRNANLQEQYYAFNGHADIVQQEVEPEDQDSIDESGDSESDSFDDGDDEISEDGEFDDFMIQEGSVRLQDPEERSQIEQKSLEPQTRGL